MIEVEKLVKQYGSYTAVRGISFSVRPGEIFAFLGVNGAGKTSTLRMLAGILLPTSGVIRIGGIDSRTEPLKTKAITGLIPDRPYLYPKLTAEEFLYFCADLYDVPRTIAAERIEELLATYTLTYARHELIESFSHGMKQRLATCSALIHAPQVLIVDEPMVGLDPHGARTLKKKLREYAAGGMTIMLSTHSLNVAEEIADRIAIIHAGEIRVLGTLAEIRASVAHQASDLESLFISLTHHEVAHP